MHRAALVTGGGRRLGRAMALDLAARGTAVAVHYNASRDEAEAVAAEARALGVGAAALQADLLDRAATARLVPEAAAALGGPLDVLVNNASIFEHDTIETATWESWDRHIGSNLRAPFELIQAFAAQAPRAVPDAAGEPVARAAIVNVIDQRVRKLTPEFATYTIAKMGLWALTRTAAQGLAPHVRVNAIGPGPTLRADRQSEEHFRRQRAATALGRGASEAEICAALRFLLDAPGVTGQLVCVDGGQHLAWRTADVLGVE
ncbi:SDR family oxidoreductase [Amaricoccus sp.]|uniref:SDR family oxidoreductase n=1 Tax=Amaricoccus sp. TaxID=1872485 RepID=UPI001B51561E|nr:SDR family oxidoreductase [Amaricoccus sp.]MBP7000788.1 SDR family oxidoreductase [Amaricoccus sp.]